MGLTNKKEEQLRKMPNVVSKVTKSKDGVFLIHKTIITDIKPVKYYEAVMASAVEEEIQDSQQELKEVEA